jgi:hypothetical protein
MDTRYNAKPVHLYTLAFPFLLLGTVMMGFEGRWWWLGLTTFLLGVGAAIWIALAGIWKEYNERRDNEAYNIKSITHDMQLMARVKDPNVWEVMGYKLPSPEPARIEERPKEPTQLPRLSFPTPPATHPQMEMLANDVLRGGSMSESRWSGKGKAFSTPKYRELMAWGEHPDRKYWRFINPAYPKQGRVPTKRGTEFLLYYADPEVQNLYKTQHMNRGEVAARFGNPRILEEGE